MKLGAISEIGYSLRTAKEEAAALTFHSFSISAGHLSFAEMPDSAFATPARYVQEIFSRLCMLEENGEREAKFIVNPLFATNRLTLLPVLNALRKSARASGMTVLVDADDVPTGYLLPESLASDDGRFLTLLSTVSGTTDAELLRLLFSFEVRRVPVESLRLSRFDNNGFSYREFRNVYLWLAERTVALLKRRAGVSPVPAQEWRDAVPFTAIMPFHAGDALFFAIAFNNTATHISGIVVNRAYADVVADNAPRLRRLVIDLAPPNRDNKPCKAPTPDSVYFERLKEQLPENSFYYFCRQSRNYNLSDIHLIDQFAFALGRRCCSNTALLLQTVPAPRPFRPSVPANPLRILLHFDGGWPLKVYPKQLQEELIGLLEARGYAITILAGSADGTANRAVTTFQGYPHFVELVRKHHLLIGMDSFPCHYAAHVLGLPTICLFSSTKPANSNARRSAIYGDFEAGLSCRPCYAASECPIYRDPNCRNFTRPDVVANAADRMLTSAAGAVPSTFENVPSPWIEDPCQPFSPNSKCLRQISLDHLAIKAVLAGLLCSACPYSAMLHREFMAAVRREGFLPAVRRTMRYIRKAVTRTKATRPFNTF
jgi:hypothetical protein